MSRFAPTTSFALREDNKVRELNSQLTIIISWIEDKLERIVSPLL
ncbi:hypothetical protein HYP99_gp003 [Sinorhizobium phage ort11]|uniref:Uncharacterized protein n=1 Tax=Sinorhizobium phage ort11 TaxID=2599764 RepID=A0A5C2H708_9CAUD|nr:hypothetical protein HYP99_gp003 [Sinorhizobium phage ort11]QEP29801.1 hypothetical protein Smphiort11_003 [Sinorhizobium phage ort11]